MRVAIAASYHIPNPFGLRELWRKIGNRWCPMKTAIHLPRGHRAWLREHADPWHTRAAECEHHTVLCHPANAAITRQTSCLPTGRDLSSAIYCTSTHVSMGRIVRGARVHATPALQCSIIVPPLRYEASAAKMFDLFRAP
jgi:hypothetical protein